MSTDSHDLFACMREAQRISDEEAGLPGSVACPYCGTMGSKWGRTWTMAEDGSQTRLNPCGQCNKPPEQSADVGPVVMGIVCEDMRQMAKRAMKKYIRAIKALGEQP